MLSLGRKQGETVKIGDDIEVVVLFIRGDYVRLGFIAPKDTLILRSELTKREQHDQSA